MARTDILEKEEQFRQWAEIEHKSLKELSQLLDCSITTVKNYAQKLNIQCSLQLKNPRVKPGNIYEDAGLEVIERDYNPPFKSHETAWKCRCIYCDEIKTYRKTNLDQGVGCQCRKDIAVGRGYKKWNIGDRFGFLEIIDRGKTSIYVKCKCDCGTIKDVRLAHLYGNHHSRTISCGCYGRSSGELKIKTILEENHINYVEQYNIPDLSLFMKFDFAIFNNEQLIGLIEYNGEQHYNPIEKWGGESKLIEQQLRDKRKMDYCNEHNIPLLVIPYWDYDNITFDYLLSSFAEIRK